VIATAWKAIKVAMGYENLSAAVPLLTLWAALASIGVLAVLGLADGREAGRYLAIGLLVLLSAHSAWRLSGKLSATTARAQARALAAGLCLVVFVATAASLWRSRSQRGVPRAAVVNE